MADTSKMRSSIGTSVRPATFSRQNSITHGRLHNASIDCIMLIYRCRVRNGKMSDDLDEVQKSSLLLVPSTVPAEFLKPGPVKVIFLGVSVAI